MASSEPAPRWTQDLRWRVGLWVFAVLLGVGGACATWALQSVQARGLQAARADALAVAQSVAQTLAQQLGRAVRLGIPLAELPGLPPYLQTARTGQPAIVAIVVQDADGRTLATAGVPPPKVEGPVPTDAVSLAIGRAGHPAGTVMVHTDSGAALRGSLWQAGVLAALAVVLTAAGAALLAGLGPGAQLEHERRAVWSRLGMAAAEDLATGPAVATAARHGPQAVLQALATGEAAQQAARQALDAYAEELLAVDFDGQLRLAIERIQHGAGTAPEHG